MRVLWLWISAGIVIAATTPIMPRVIRTSARVKANLLEVNREGWKVKGALTAPSPVLNFPSLEIFTRGDFTRLLVSGKFVKFPCPMVLKTASVIEKALKKALRFAFQNSFLLIQLWTPLSGAEFRLFVPIPPSEFWSYNCVLHNILLYSLL